MLLLLLLSLGLLLLISLLLLYWQLNLLIFQPGAIYYPSTTAAVNSILRLAHLTSRDTIIDLGSGDGRILLAAAKIGARAYGFETNPFLVWHCRRLIRQSGLQHKAIVYWKSFWHADLAPATIVTVYLSPHLMSRLHRHLLSHPSGHSRYLISNQYPIPGLKPYRQSPGLYLYRL